MQWCASLWSMSTHDKTGVILMTYGSATTAEHVPAYFERIYKGKASAALIADFQHRYTVVGRSPLIDITRTQADALNQMLGDGYVVRAGMRHSAPYIADAVAECVTSGATSLIGIILAPQFSSLIMEGYATDFLAAAHAHGISDAHVASPWPTQEHFVALLARRIREQLDTLGDVPVIFTTHSLPKRVVDLDPSYLTQLQQTIDAVCAHMPQSLEWYQGYQSAGHTPEEWLKPDLTDIIGELKQKGHERAVVVPIQFLADHLEILYDLDVAARAQCEDAGMYYHRTELPNTDPQFIAALADIVRSAVPQL